MKNRIRFLLLLGVFFWYYVANGLLTRILTPLENRYHLYWQFHGTTYNIIDSNIPHVVAFVVMGVAFKFWALLFAIGMEILQALRPHKNFSVVDMLLNMAGSLIGIGILILFQQDNKKVGQTPRVRVNRGQVS